MNNSHAFNKQQAPRVFAVLILVLTLLSSTVAPVYASHPANVRSSRALSPSFKTVAVRSPWALPLWLPSVQPLAAPSPLGLLAIDVQELKIEEPIGTAIATRTLTADDAVTLYAIGHNGGITESQIATWALPAGATIGNLAVLVGISTTFTAESVGSATLTATLVATPTISTTIQITVTPGALASIVIRDATDGNGSEVGTHNMTTDDELTVYAAGYDADDNYISDVSVTWGTTGDLDAVPAGPATSATFAPSSARTSGTITADDGSAPTGATGVITVDPGVLASIVIRDATDGNGSEVGTHNMTTDDELTVYAAGYDADDNYISDISVTWSTAGDLDAVPAGPTTSVTFAPSSADTSGAITADDGSGHTDATGAITVDPGALDYFTVTSPTPRTAGVSFIVTVTAYDADGNPKTDYNGTVALTSSDPRAVLPTDDGTDWSNGAKDFTLRLITTGAQTYTVQDGAISETSASITVNPAALDYFEMSGYPTEVTAGESWDNYSAAVIVTAYDRYDNVKTDYAGQVYFTSTDLRAVLPYTSGSRYTFVPGDDEGSHSFPCDDFVLYTTLFHRITVRGGGESTQSTNILVNPALLGEFIISNVPDGVAGVPFQLNITALDLWDNLKTDYTGRPDLTDTTGSILPIRTDANCFFPSGTCEQTAAITRAMNDIRVAVTDGSVSEQSNNFDVSPASLHHIRINSAPDNGGQGYEYPVEVGVHVMDIYQTYNVWTAGYDQFDNYRDDLSADWGLTGVLAQGEIAPTSGISTTFSPAPILSGTGIITAVYGGLTDSTGLFTIQAPWLIIEKIGPPYEVPAGTTKMEYTITWRNVGTALAQNIHITDTYDNNVYDPYGTGSPAYHPGSLVWTVPALPAGDQGGATLLVDVVGSLTPGTILENLVEIGGPRIETHTFIETTIVTATPDLSVFLNDDVDDPVGAGGELDLQVTFDNNGNAPVNNIVFSLTLDSHLTFLRSEGFDPVISPSQATGNEGRWELSILGGHDEFDFFVTVQVDEFMVDGYVLLHRAVINSDDEGPAYATEDTSVTAPVLVLTQVAAPRPAIAYSPLTFTLAYSNVGQADASALHITDTVPDNTDFVSCSPAPCDENDGIVTWEPGDLASMDGGVVNMVVNVDRNLDPGTVLTNHAGVWVYAAFGYSATAILTTTVVSTPSLGLNISDGKLSVEAGEEVIYTVSYTNTGSGRAYSTTIVATPPSSARVGDVGCLPEAACVSEGGQLVYDVGTVEGGESDSVHMVVRVHDPLPAGALDITALTVINTVTPGDALMDNVSQDVDAVTTRPDLELEANYSTISPYPGKRITYTLAYINSGHIATEGVIITATQPHYTTYDSSVSSNWQELGDGHYYTTLGSLDYDEGGLLSFVVTLPTGTFTTTMPNFDAAFGIYDDGISGIDGDLSNNVIKAPLGVPDISIQDVEINWATLWSGQVGKHITVTLENQGTGVACSPGADGTIEFCYTFYIDLYINPDFNPVSHPTGPPFSPFYHQYAGPMQPGAVESYTIYEFDYRYEQMFKLPPGVHPMTLYAQVDNYNNESMYPNGLVFESNEWNNVYGPIVPPHSVFLPAMMHVH